MRRWSRRTSSGRCVAWLRLRRSRGLRPKAFVFLLPRRGRGCGSRRPERQSRRYAKGLPSCKTAYNVLDPSSTNPDKPSALERWRQKRTSFDVKWNTQLSDDLATRAAKVLRQINPRG